MDSPAREELESAIADYRATRDVLETSVLPLATSVDGRAFRFQVSLHGLELQAGAYVTIESSDTAPRLGQVLSLAVEENEAVGSGSTSHVRLRLGAGEGVVLSGERKPFHDARVRAATPDEVAAWLEEIRPAGAQLPVGELALAPGVPFALDASGFGRHTFLCGQSGSGKTYSLGVLLEHLLVETSLRVVVLDPNSDYVRLGDPVADDERYRDAAAAVAVRSGDDIKIRFRDLSPSHQAALLRIDPLTDREEYAEMLDLIEDESVRGIDELPPDRAQSLRLRMRNLGVGDYGVWPRADQGSTPVPDELVDPDGPRCLVVDLGSLGGREEASLVAGAVLERLWATRARRAPIAIVIDEAHNVCPAEPADPQLALATADAVRIAAEGRKFGLYLIVVTQRPQKVHPNVVSQCDNLVLMRVNSAADVAHLSDVFSFVPRGLIAKAPAFAQGEALVAGKISSHPALIRFGARRSHEGGADVPADWAG